MPEVESPIDGAPCYAFETLSEREALACLERARVAQRGWREVSITERVALCRSFVEAYAWRAEESAREITRAMGKPFEQAQAEFERTLRERVEHLCAIAESALADEVLPAQPGVERRIRREPVGVVLDIAAWNYPLAIAVNVIVPAVLAGNAVLIKHASRTTCVGEQLARAFREAGASDALVQSTPMEHATTAALIASRGLGYVSFTGSVRGGREVYRAVAEHDFIGAGLELGGKDPAIVLEDAPLESTVENLVDGAFYNAGQSCCAVERIYVAASRFDAFVEAFVARTRRYRIADPLGDGVDMGPMVDESAADFVREQVVRARAAGARVLLGDLDFELPDTSPCYLAPHVLVDVDSSMSLMRDETFGPAIGIQAFADEDQAVQLANDSDFGLTASVWSADRERAGRIAERLEAGTVYVNRCDYLDPGLAWTGVKDSGMGCSLSRAGFAAVTRPKSYYLREPSS